MYYLHVQGHYEEISWRDFVNNYLYTGKVDRLTVINKKWVKVQLLDANSTNKQLWFTIGKHS